MLGYEGTWICFWILLGGDSENHNILTEDGKQFQFIHPCLHLGGDTLPQGIKPLIPVLFLAYFLEAASQKKYVLPFDMKWMAKLVRVIAGKMLNIFSDLRHCQTSSCFACFGFRAAAAWRCRGETDRMLEGRPSDSWRDFRIQCKGLGPWGWDSLRYFSQEVSELNPTLWIEWWRPSGTKWNWNWLSWL